MLCAKRLFVFEELWAAPECCKRLCPPSKEVNVMRVATSRAGEGWVGNPQLVGGNGCTLSALGFECSSFVPAGPSCGPVDLVRDILTQTGG